MSSETGLAIRSEQPGVMSVFDRIEPMAFVEAFGRTFALTGAGGCKTVEDGKLMALACLCERKSIFDISREFHLMDGKLSMKAETMLARFRQKGGKHRWLKTGDDGQAAELELTFDGQTIVSRYTIEDAKQAKLIKTGGNWEKSPRTMLRARCCSEGVRMLAPEISGGYYTPEENDDVAADRPATPVASPETVKAVKARKQELKEMNAQSTSGPAADTASAQGEVVDAEFTVTADAKSEPVATSAIPTTATEPATTAPAATVIETTATVTTTSKPTDATLPGSATTETLMEIENLLVRAGTTKAAIEEQIRKKNPEVTTLDSLSEVSALQLCKNLTAKVEALKKS